MKFTRKTRIIKVFLLVVIVSILGLCITAYFYQKKSRELHENLRSPSKLAYAKGISFVEYHEDKKVYSISIDSFSIERARIGPFAIGPLRIAHLDKVNVDLYVEGSESKLGKNNVKEEGWEGKTPDFEAPILNIRRNLPYDVKKIKGIDLKDISANLWENGERIFRISSDKATVDRQTGDLVFTGHANIDAGKNGKVISHRIRWDRKTRLFKIMDSYYFIRDGKQIEGKGIETDYLLKRISHLPQGR